MADTCSIFSTWSDPLLTLYLTARHVALPSTSPSHGDLVSLANSSISKPVSPVSSTEVSVFNLMTLGHLNYYLTTKRDQAVNMNARWGIGCPPNTGRIKVNALREFAKKDAQDISQGELNEFVAETLGIKVQLREEGRMDLGAVFLREDDIDVLFADWGIKRDPQWDHEKSLDVMQRSLDLFGGR